MSSFPVLLMCFTNWFHGGIAATQRGIAYRMNVRGKLSALALWPDAALRRAATLRNDGALTTRLAGAAYAPHVVGGHVPYDCKHAKLTGMGPW